MSYPAEKMKDVFTILKMEGRKDRWLRVGIGFINRDNSITVKLDAVPTNGTLHIRDYVPRIGRIQTSTQDGTDETVLRPSPLDQSNGEMIVHGALP